MSEKEDGPEIYEVERIEKKKIETNGSEYYFIKWKDYPEEDNTWPPLFHSDQEPADNLECEELMEDFAKRASDDPKLITDKRSKQKRKDDEATAAALLSAPATITKASSKKREPARSKQSSGTTKRSGSKSSSQSVANGKTGFDEGLTAEDILGATDSSGRLMYLIKWKERNEASLVDAKIAHAKCPQVVINYLTKKITFLNDSEN